MASKYEELECLYAAVGKVIYEGLTNYEKATNANPSQLFGEYLCDYSSRASLGLRFLLPGQLSWESLGGLCCLGFCVLSITCASSSESFAHPQCTLDLKIARALVGELLSPGLCPRKTDLDNRAAE